MITYPDGSAIQVGDFILFERRSTPGTVYELIETAEQIQQRRVEVPGILVESIPDGLAFLPTESLVNDPIAFVSRPRSGAA